MSVNSETMSEVTLQEVKESAVRQQKEEEDFSIDQLIVFELAGEEYALHIDDVKEIVLTPAVARIPHTPDYIMGVANIRGTIIAIMNLEKKFSLEEENDKTPYRYTLVIESTEHKVGILSRKVPSTLSVKSSQIERDSSIVQYSMLDDDCIEGIVKTGDRLVILVNVKNILKDENLGIEKI